MNKIEQNINIIVRQKNNGENAHLYKEKVICRYFCHVRDYYVSFGPNWNLNLIKKQKKNKLQPLGAKVQQQTDEGGRRRRRLVFALTLMSKC